MTRRLTIPRLLAAVVLLAGAVSLAGCGYALVGRASNLPPDIKTVYLKPLENRTSRQQIEQILTRAIASELVTRKRFAVASDAAGADAEISGAVVAFSVVPVAFDQTGRAKQYEIAVTAQVKFRRLKDDKVIWSNDRYNFRESYDVVGTSLSYFDQENSAIEKVAPQFAQTMVSDLLEGF
ncbi:MAG: LPS assembly lipoprotein LptE [Acidobacteriota bacterium]